MLLNKRQPRCDAEDFAGEAVATTVDWLGSATEVERRVWKYGITTCRRLLAYSLRSVRVREVTRDSMDRLADQRSVRSRHDCALSNDLSTSLATLLHRLRGTARDVLLMLQERPWTNQEMAAALGVQLRTVELARQTIRERAGEIRADFFGVEPPSCRRRCRRPTGREAEQGDPAC
jgi:DNA-directed RNA polymerase specialized sigma24 family protein